MHDMQIRGQTVALSIKNDNENEDEDCKRPANLCIESREKK
jgi:hypothetical protein